jgi:hypothetical protein
MNPNAFHVNFIFNRYIQFACTGLLVRETRRIEGDEESRAMARDASTSLCHLLIRHSGLYCKSCSITRSRE